MESTTGKEERGLHRYLSVIAMMAVGIAALVGSVVLGVEAFRSDCNTSDMPIISAENMTARTAPSGVAPFVADSEAEADLEQGTDDAPSQSEASQETPEWLRRLFDPVERSKAGTPRHIWIGLDLSKSNPLVDDPNFALKVADYIKKEITDLPVKSIISLRTFGVDSAEANTLRQDHRITTADSATQEADFFHTLIRNVPTLIARGTIEAQDYTNIVSFMINIGGVVDCENFETMVILATDGIEDSEFARLKDSTQRLPAPEQEFFEGCSELLMLGVGQGQNSPRTTARLRRDWERWARAAGFQRFRGLNNW